MLKDGKNNLSWHQCLMEREMEINNNHLQYNKENISFDRPSKLSLHIYMDLHTNNRNRSSLYYQSIQIKWLN